MSGHRIEPRFSKGELRGRQISLDMGMPGRVLVGPFVCLFDLVEVCQFALILTIHTSISEECLSRRQ